MWYIFNFHHNPSILSNGCIFLLILCTPGISPYTELCSFTSIELSHRLFCSSFVVLHHFFLKFILSLRSCFISGIQIIFTFHFIFILFWSSLIAFGHHSFPTWRLCLCEDTVECIMHYTGSTVTNFKKKCSLKPIPAII